MEFHRSAFKHGYHELAILHAIDHAITVTELDPDADPPKVLAIDPDPAGNFMEVIWLDLDNSVQLVIHAMVWTSGDGIGSGRCSPGSHRSRAAGRD